MNSLKPEAVLFVKILNIILWRPHVSLNSTIANIVLVDDSPYKRCGNSAKDSLFPDVFATNKHATANMKAVLLPYF